MTNERTTNGAERGARFIGIVCREERGRGGDKQFV